MRLLSGKWVILPWLRKNIEIAFCALGELVKLHKKHEKLPYLCSFWQKIKNNRFSYILSFVDQKTSRATVPLRTKSLRLNNFFLFTSGEDSQASGGTYSSSKHGIFSFLALFWLSCIRNTTQTNADSDSKHSFIGSSHFHFSSMLESSTGDSDCSGEVEAKVPVPAAFLVFSNK
jgi:hypothetical protein